MEKHEKILFIIAVFILIYLLIMFLFFPPRARAGEVHGHFYVGYLVEDEDFVTDLCLSYEFWIITLRGEIETLMEPNLWGSVFFCPYRNTYYFNINIQPFEHLFVDVSQQCTHAVFSYSKQFWDKFEGGNRTTLSVGIRW